MSELPKRLLPPPASTVAHSSDNRAARRSKLSCVVSWLFSKEREERGSSWALVIPVPVQCHCNGTSGREGESRDVKGWEHL